MNVASGKGGNSYEVLSESKKVPHDFSCRRHPHGGARPLLHRGIRGWPIAEYGIIYIGIGDIGVDGAGGAVQQVAVIDVAAVDHHKGAGAGDGEIAEASGAQVQVGDGRAVVMIPYSAISTKMWGNCMSIPRMP